MDKEIESKATATDVPVVESFGARVQRIRRRKDRIAVLLHAVSYIERAFLPDGDQPPQHLVRDIEAGVAVEPDMDEVLDLVAELTQQAERLALAVRNDLGDPNALDERDSYHTPGRPIRPRFGLEAITREDYVESLRTRIRGRVASE